MRPISVLIRKPTLRKSIKYIAWILAPITIQAGTFVIDDFSFEQTVRSREILEASDSSIFGGYRRMIANGFVTVVVVDGQILPSGETSGAAQSYWGRNNWHIRCWCHSTQNIIGEI